MVYALNFKDDSSISPWKVQFQGVVKARLRESGADKMADGELNVDSLITRLLENKN